MTGGGAVRGIRVTLRVALVGAMGVFVVAFTVALALHSMGVIPAAAGWFDVVVNDWLGLLTVWVPAFVGWVTVVRVGFRRWEVPLAAAALLRSPPETRTTW